MAKIVLVIASVENLNHNNYKTWSTRIYFYLFEQALWDNVGGSNTTQSISSEDLNKWTMKVEKAIYILFVIIEDDLLQHI